MWLYVYGITFYWRELDCKLLQGYLKQRINKLNKKIRYRLGFHDGIEIYPVWCKYFKSQNCLKIYPTPSEQ